MKLQEKKRSATGTRTQTFPDKISLPKKWQKIKENLNLSEIPIDVYGVVLIGIDIDVKLF